MEESSAKASAASPSTSVPRPPSISLSKPPSYVPISAKSFLSASSVGVGTALVATGGAGLLEEVVAVAEFNVEEDVFLLRRLRTAPGVGREDDPGAPWYLDCNLEEDAPVDVDVEGASLLILSSESLSVRFFTFAIAKIDCW